MNQEQKDRVAAEFLDGAREVFVICGEHNYTPQKAGIDGLTLLPPTNECKYCMKAYLLVYFASLPPHVREQRLQELERGTHKMVELMKQGRWDFQPFRHPEIGFEKE